MKKWQFWREQLKKFIDAIHFAKLNKKLIASLFSKFYKITMANIRELSFEQRVAVKYLRESGLPYREIGRQIGCNHSIALRIYKKNVSTSSVSKRADQGFQANLMKGGKEQFVELQGG